jgi:hypothetical protein
VLVTPALGGDLAADTAFAVARPNHGAIAQIAELRADGRHADAALIEAMIETPNAEWFTQGTPKSVRQEVRNEVNRAAAMGTLPVLVAYNIPFRDCAQFSAGGATTVAEYLAWIDGFAAGIGDRPAVVILEPDGLGIIPWYDPYGSADGSSALEWCQPAEADPSTAAAERFAMLNQRSTFSTHGRTSASTSTARTAPGSGWGMRRIGSSRPASRGQMGSTSTSRTTSSRRIQSSTVRGSRTASRTRRA